MSIHAWFKKYVNLPLMILCSLSSLIYIFFVAYTFFNNNQLQEKSFKDLILTTVQLGMQKNDRVLIESAMERSVENLGAKFAFLCKGDDLIIRVVKEIRSCQNLPKASLFDHIIKFNNFGYEGYSLYFYVDRFPLNTNQLLLLLFVCAIFIILYWILFRVRKNLIRDVISPIQDNLLSDKKLSILEFENLKSYIEESQNVKIKQAELQIKAESRRKFAHNVRAPLSTLKAFRNMVKDKLLPRELTLLSNGLEDVESLTEGINKENRIAIKNNEAINLQTYQNEYFESPNKILKQIISSKTEQFKNEALSINFETNISDQTLLYLNPIEFKSIVLNIISNAKEAKANKVNIKIDQLNNDVSIEIKNNGEAIPKEIQENIFFKDFTHNKEQGTGFGLYHARKYLNKWNGEIKLVESSNNTTTFNLSIPFAKIPKLDLDKTTELLIMENDEWERKNIIQHAKTLTNDSQIKVFTQSDELDAYLQKKPKNFVLLADNDVGRGYKTGLDYILDNNLQENSYLVTNSYDDVNIVKKAVKNNLNIVPKILFIS